jgi:2-oxoglutarate ferredoxin oxidoreductase subunit delta
MGDAAKLDRGLLQVDADECKGCGLCVQACPPRVIRMTEQLDHYGYRTAMYAGAGCTGCGICFMACPEPGAITVLHAVHRKPDGGLKLNTERDINIQGASRWASN